jgi:cytoskeletal protein CcmA (bactofilin family)
MSACWASRLAGALALATMLGATALPAAARARAHATTRDSGHVVGGVRLEGGTLTIDDSSTGQARSGDSGDTLGQGALVVEGDGNGMVRFLSDAVVHPGEHLEGDVVAIFGNVHVQGAVTGSAVAVFGNVQIEPGGSVGGDAVAVLGGQRDSGPVRGTAVAVLGSVELRPGATVGGDAVAVGGQVSSPDGSRISGQSVSLSLLPLTFGLPGLPTAIALVLLGWLVSVFFGWVFATLFPERLARIAVTSSRRTFLSIVIAVLSFFLWPIASILIMATIVGLPVGIILWLIYPVLVYAGQLAASYVLGCKLMRRRLGEGSAIGPISAGSLLIALLFVVGAIAYSAGGLGGAVALFFTLVAVLVLVGLTLIGTGAILLSRAGTLPHELHPAGASEAVHTV